MEVVVDGKTGLALRDKGATVADALARMRRETAKQGRVVLSFTLDDEVITPELEEKLSERPQSEFGMLEVRTVDPAPVALETLKGLRGHLSNLEKTHEEVESLHKTGTLGKALERIEDCSRGWGILQRGVRDVGALLAADLKQLQADGESVDARILSLQQALQRVKACLEFKDVPRGVETAQNELRPALKTWGAVIEALKRYVAERAS